MKNKSLIVTIAVVVVVLAAAWVWKQNLDRREVQQAATEEQQEQPMDDAASTPQNEQAQQQPASVNGCQRTYSEEKYRNSTVSTKSRQVEFDVKDYGKIVLSLNDSAAPKTVENFLKLVDAGFYDCLTFHRIAKNFVIQGGDPKGDGTGGPGWTVPAEIKLNHKRGSIAMARLPDQANPARDSSGSQFYIALNDLAMLDGAYTVFGDVVSGIDVVDKISGVPINPGPFGDSDGSPKAPIVIQKASIIK